MDLAGGQHVFGSVTAPEATAAGRFTIEVTPCQASALGALQSDIDSPHLARQLHQLVELLGRRQREQQLNAVVVTGAPGNHVTSVTTVELAMALAAGGASVLVVDANLRRPAVHGAPGISIDPAIRAVGPERRLPVRQLSAGVHVLTAGTAVTEPVMLEGSFWADLLAVCRSAFQWVLLDAPSIGERETASLLHVIPTVVFAIDVRAAFGAASMALGALPPDAAVGTILRAG